MNITAIILAGGNGKRMNLGKNKLLYEIDGQTIIEKTINQFTNCSFKMNYILTYSPSDKEKFEEIANKFSFEITLVEGGKTRTESVKNALLACDKATEFVVIHDGARAFVEPRIIDNCLNTAFLFGSAVASVPAVDTMAVSSENDLIDGYANRETLYHIQTPQAFVFEDILTAYNRIVASDEFTDDSSVYLKYFSKPHLSLGDHANIKITYFDDLKKLNVAGATMIGNGYDFHRLVPNRKLILGGVEIPFETGLLGHSDADVLVHAIMDSLLSSIHEKDIGCHFPDTDPKYKGISSIELLHKVGELLAQKNAIPTSISATLICQRPKLASYIPQMQRNIAQALNISSELVTISASTMEGEGEIGNSKGIASTAVSLVFVAYEKIT